MQYHTELKKYLSYTHILFKDNFYLTNEAFKEIFNDIKFCGNKELYENDKFKITLINDKYTHYRKLYSIKFKEYDVDMPFVARYYWSNPSPPGVLTYDGFYTIKFKDYLK